MVILSRPGEPSTGEAEARRLCAAGIYSKIPFQKRKMSSLFPQLCLILLRKAREAIVVGAPGETSRSKGRLKRTLVGSGRVLGVAQWHLH